MVRSHCLKSFDQVRLGRRLCDDHVEAYIMCMYAMLADKSWSERFYSWSLNVRECSHLKYHEVNVPRNSGSTSIYGIWVPRPSLSD